MIKSLTVTNYRSKSLTITLNEADPSHGLIISGITGIGPSDAVLNDSEYATNDGSEFNSTRLDKRSIQITFILTSAGGCTIEEARHNTYIYFPTKKQVRLVFETDTRTCYCYGYVEHNTPDIFQQQESITIDIVCYDPYFYKYNNNNNNNEEDVVEELSLTTANFSSEYENPDDEDDETLETYYTNEDDPNLELSTYNSSGIISTNFYNEGDAEVGFDVNIHFNGSITGDIIIADDDMNQIKIDTSIVEELIDDSITSGDTINLSTNPKKRYCTFTRNAVTTNILNALDFDNLTWLYIYPGDNIIYYYVDSGVDNTEATFSYKQVYLGV